MIFQTLINFKEACLVFKEACLVFFVVSYFLKYLKKKLPINFHGRRIKSVHGLSLIVHDNKVISVIYIIIKWQIYLISILK